MKKTIALLSVIVMVVAVYSCKKNTANTLTTTAYLDLPSTTASYYNNNGFPDSIISQRNNQATLGRVLFYDCHLSTNNAIACASCHKQAYAFADNVALSRGYQGMLTKRNSIGISNTSQSFAFFWDGRETNLTNLALRPLTNHVEMGVEDYTSLSNKLAAFPYYGQLFANAFGDSQVTADRISLALAMFMNAINSTHSRLDDFSAGNSSALTAQEIQGKMLFDTKYNCGSCHNNGSGGGGGYSGGGGATFLDIGLDQTYTDLGHGVITQQATDNGTFKVPNLRNVALTAPYMHDGRYKTLNDVLEHYSHGINASPNLDTRLNDSSGHPMQMNITDADKQAIIAFLGTLTDYQLVTDPKFSNPFKVK